MFLACVLLIIATLSGVLLTFLFDRAAPLSARLCLGAPIGLTILAWTGFIFSLVFGMSAASIALATLITGLPAFLLLSSGYRTRVSTSLSVAKERMSAALRSRDRVTGSR